MARRSLCRARLRLHDSAYCVRASRLFHGLHVARGDVSHTRALARLAKTELLVIDRALVRTSRIEGPWSSMTWAVWMSRSQIATARVGYPITSCRALTGS